jgi:hypothetical protein
VFRAAIERPFYASVDAAAAALEAGATATAGTVGQRQGSRHAGLGVLGSDNEGEGMDEVFDGLQGPAAAAAAGGLNGTGFTVGNGFAEGLLSQDSAAAAAAAAAGAGGSDTPAAAAAAAAVMGAVTEALTPRYKCQERDGVRRLLALLQPLMWRTSKAVADLDHPLPPRCVWH